MELDSYMNSILLDLVQVARPRKFGSLIIGHLWGGGDRLLFLSELNSDILALDGFTILTKRHVRSIDRDFDEKNFYSVVLRNRPQNLTKKLQSMVECDDIVAVLQKLQRLKSLIAVSLELVSTDFCFVGYVTSVSDKSFSLGLVSNVGILRSGEQMVDLKSVTRIEFDTRYLRAMSRFIRHRDQ